MSGSELDRLRSTGQADQWNQTWKKENSPVGLASLPSTTAGLGNLTGHGSAHGGEHGFAGLAVCLSGLKTLINDNVAAAPVQRRWSE